LKKPTQDGKTLKVSTAERLERIAEEVCQPTFIALPAGKYPAALWGATLGGGFRCFQHRLISEHPCGIPNTAGDFREVINMR